jgi:predicted ABC-type transport system involved in lysophospholipase L1 biosynthesis ATPase subunit
MERVGYAYPRRGGAVQVLADVTLRVAPGERVAVVGASGSGKSTVLALASGVLRPTGGRVAVDGLDLGPLDADARAAVRLWKVAHVYQDFRLLPMLSAVENVAVVPRLRGVPAAEAIEAARDALHRVGMSRRAQHRPAELSGGEQQRVALARAFVAHPLLLLADEPTGSLDAGLRDDVLGVLLDVCAESAVVLVTHDPQVATVAHRTVDLRAGRLTDVDRSR